jgi:radical SAM superfamily enzyme YgiQ (UPF0313 family)
MDKVIVTLINPPSLKTKKNVTAVMKVPPIGLAYIAGAINDICEVNVVDAIGESIDQSYEVLGDLMAGGLTYDEIISKIDPKTLIIGFSAMFSNSWIFHFDILKRIRKEFPDTLIVIGGEHVTANPELVINDMDQNTICVIGEGEETFREICENINDFDRTQITGIAYADSKGEFVSSRRSRIKKLDDIQRPLWDNFKITNYIQSGNGGAILNQSSMPMLVSRGCPFTCSFCSAPVMWGTNYYLRNPELVVLEIIDNIKKYNIKNIEFMDLVGVFNKKWLREFRYFYKKHNLTIGTSFSPGTRSEILDKEMLEILRDINIIRVMYAPDSGSEKEAKRINKNVNFKKIIESMKTCVSLGIPCRANILIGFPEQKLSDLVNTFIFSIKLAWIGVNDVIILNFVPYAGSQFYNELKENLPDKDQYLISQEYLLRKSINTVGYVQSYSEYIPSLILSIFRTSLLILCILIHYLRRPYRIFSLIRNVINKRPRTILENILYIKLYKNG